MFTRNTRDYAALHAEWAASAREHAGMIVLTDQATPVGAILRAMNLLAESFDSQSIRNRLIYLRNFVFRT